MVLRWRGQSGPTSLNAKALTQFLDSRYRVDNRREAFLLDGLKLRKGCLNSPLLFRKIERVLFRVRQRSSLREALLREVECIIIRIGIGE